MNEQKSNDLLQIVKDNPDLPIVPIVDAEIVGDGYGHYVGAWGGAYVEEYIVCKRYDNLVIFKSDDDVFEALEHFMSDEELETLPDDEDECRPYYDKLPWKKVIIVYINTLG